MSAVRKGYAGGPGYARSDPPRGTPAIAGYAQAAAAALGFLRP